MPLPGKRNIDKRKTENQTKDKKMKLSPYLSHDTHPAILTLRVGTITATIVDVVAFSWMLKAHERVYTDGVGELYTLFPLIFVSHQIPPFSLLSH